MGMALEISGGGFVWCWNLDTSERIARWKNSEISCTDRVKNDEVLQTIKEERDILVQQKEESLTGQVTSCVETTV